MNEALRDGQRKKTKKIAADPLTETTINGLCHRVMALQKACEDEGKGGNDDGQNGENEKNREKSKEKDNPSEHIPLIWWPEIAGC